MPDPKLIQSKHNGPYSSGHITVQVSIYRLEDTKWTLEVIDGDGDSIVWDAEFDTDDEAREVFLACVELEGIEGILRDPAMAH